MLRISRAWKTSCCAVVVAAVQVSGCGSDKPVSAAAHTANPPATLSLPTDQRRPKPVAPELIASGPIIVEHEVNLTAQRDGVVTKIFYDVGAQVKAGTLLAQFDDRELKAQLEAARAKCLSIEDDLNNWKAERQVMQADYVRAQQLRKEGLTSEEQVEHAKYQVVSHDWDINRVSELLENAKDEQRSLELEMDKTRIVAPFDGVIARRYIRESQDVAKGDRVFWITTEAPLLIRFTVPESFFGKLRRGQVLEIASADAPGEWHSARVSEISPVIDPASGTFEVLAELIGRRGSLRPGMTASVYLHR